MVFVVTIHGSQRHKCSMEQVDDFSCIDQVLQGNKKVFGALVVK